MADEHVVGGNRRPIQVARVKQGGWTNAARRRFLDALVETCNVTMATAAAGMRGKSAYDLRRRDPVFDRLWQDALALGYERLEQALLAHALERVNAIDLYAPPAADEGSAENIAAGHAVPGSGIPRLAPGDVQLALALLNRHRATAEGARYNRHSRRRATQEETDAALRKQLDVLARKLRDEK